MFNNILIATDGSTHAYRALDVAAQLAADRAANLTILHVLMHGSVPAGFQRMLEVENLSDPKTQEVTHASSEYPGTLAIPLHDIEYRNDDAQYFDFLGEAIVSDASKRAKKLGVTQLQTHIVNGDPADSIIQMASQHNIDLIVIGSRGLGSIKGILLGSVAGKVLQLCQCPCLSVK